MLICNKYVFTHNFKEFCLLFSGDEFDIELLTLKRLSRMLETVSIFMADEDKLSFLRQICETFMRC